MKLKKLFKKAKTFREKVNKKLMIKGYRIKFKYILDQKDSNLQDGRRFLSRKKK